MTIADLTTYLAAIGSLSLTAGTNLFAGDVDETLDDATWLMSYPGRAPDYAMGLQQLNLEYPRVQISTRSLSYVTGEARITAIVTELVKIGPTTLSSGKRYLSVLPTQSPFLLKKDANERWVFVVNVEIMKGA